MNVSFHTYINKWSHLNTSKSLKLEFGRGQTASLRLVNSLKSEIEVRVAN